MPERFLGRTLGKFRIDAVVGTGGFAWVYKAYDPELEIPVALKVLKPQYAGDEQFEQRFRREAATAARLRHPNIIKIFAVGKDGEAVYFAMDFLPQGLPDRLEVLTRLPEPVLIRMGIDVASALGFAHREGVVHRDIKVDNILFDEHGNAIVADFGIARAVSNYVQQTGTNMVVGTPQYFSPEQARGQPLDGRADIYSLGVTLYRAATGVLPFTGEDWYEIARQHVEERPARPRVHNPQLSRDLERVILRCLEKDPAARFQTGEALCQALAALSFERSDTIAMRSTPHAGTASAETPTAPITLPTGQRRWQPRPLVGGMVGLAALAALLVGVQRARNVDARAGARPPAGAAGNVVAEGAPGGPHGGARGAARAPAPGGAAAGRRAGGPSSANSSANAAGSGETARPAGGAPEVPSRASGSGAPGAHPETAGLASAESRGRTPSGSRRPHQGKSGAGGAVATQGGPPGAGAGGSTTTAQAEVGLGSLRLDARPAGALYTLEALTDGHVIKGRMPLAGPITLPAGAYAVTISARYCATFRDTVRVGTNRVTAPPTVRLVCGT